MNTVTPWPFGDAPNVMCFTVRSIISASKPLLMVHHDAEDGTWSFLTGEPIDMSEAMLVSLKSMVERDESLRDLADLPPGWTAVRLATEASWMRAPNESSAETQEG